MYFLFTCTSADAICLLPWNLHLAHEGLFCLQPKHGATDTSGLLRSLYNVWVRISSLEDIVLLQHHTTITAVFWFGSTLYPFAIFLTKLCKDK